MKTGDGPMMVLQSQGEFVDGRRNNTCRWFNEDSGLFVKEDFEDTALRSWEFESPSDIVAGQVVTIRSSFSPRMVVEYIYKDYFEIECARCLYWSDRTKKIQRDDFPLHTLVAAPELKERSDEV